jgi:hypothetical protein
MKDYEDSYITTPIKSPLFESVALLAVMPFMIVGLALAFIFILITLLVMWPIVPFFVYAERKKELTADDREE